MIENPFVGAWRLISCELRSVNGQISYPMGKDAQGYIIYSRDGYLSVAFMSSGRNPFASDDLRAGSAEEKVQAFDTYFSYCGRYEVRDEAVIHHVEVSLFPNWTGKSQERRYRFDQDQLILSAPPVLIDGIEQAAHLVWQKTAGRE
ncbi:lipocalin-like domain-containing protein [uncultured Thiodictyon sp.]|uniref:lipocalin-like domain-containing protein n=1 Tax=uncultured Thiodictyon sp. TaxID=1846217 RepID=UPI0025E1F44B|nr:lipocalin-like domain-containing protein [uncultured Thiodictyon sp.]